MIIFAQSNGYTATHGRVQSNKDRYLNQLGAQPNSCEPLVRRLVQAGTLGLKDGFNLTLLLPYIK